MGSNRVRPEFFPGLYFHYHIRRVDNCNDHLAITSSAETKPTSKATAKTESTTTKDRRQSTSAPTESLSAGAAVGIALGCLAFLLFVFVVGYSSHRYVKKNKRRISPNNEGNEMEKGSRENYNRSAPDN